MIGKRSTKSLENEIGSLEKQISTRRSNLKAASKKFIKDLNYRIAKPNVMWAAGSVGFIAGELTKRPKVKVSTKKMADHEVSRPKVTKSSSFKDLGQFVAVTYSLLNSWPVAALVTHLQKNPDLFNSKNSNQTQKNK